MIHRFSCFFLIFNASEAIVNVRWLPHCWGESYFYPVVIMFRIEFSLTERGKSAKNPPLSLWIVRRFRSADEKIRMRPFKAALALKLGAAAPSASQAASFSLCHWETGTRRSPAIKSSPASNYKHLFGYFIFITLIAVSTWFRILSHYRCSRVVRSSPFRVNTKNVNKKSGQRVTWSFELLVISCGNGCGSATFE